MTLEQLVAEYRRGSTTSSDRSAPRGCVDRYREWGTGRDSSPEVPHASDSAEQQTIEADILRALEAVLRVTFTDAAPQLKGLKLDAFAAGPQPVLVEVFAHVGPSKSGQRRKVANDMVKLLLAERRLGVSCRKVIAVIDKAAVAHHEGGWVGEFATAFEFEVIVVPGFEARHVALRAVQVRQRR